MTEAQSSPTADLTRTVSLADTATVWGAEFPPAAATPFVLGIAEVACHMAMIDELGEGEITVGTGARIEHLVASPVAAVLTARAVLVGRDRRILRFSVDVTQGEALVATIEHQRSIVQRSRILERLGES